MDNRVLSESTIRASAEREIRLLPMLGVQAKVERAKEQIMSLHREILEPSRSAAAVLSNLEGTTFRVAANPEWDEQITLRWSVIVGEIVHDLRSALDHLVWELVSADGGKPDDSTFFPVYTRAPDGEFAAYTQKARGPLVGVNKRHVDFIESSQPYQGGKAKQLGLLRELSNVDKHRHMVAAPVFLGDPIVAVVGGVIEDRQPARTPDDEPVFVVHVRPTGRERPQLTVSYEIGPDLAFGQKTSTPGRSVVEVLSVLAAHVLDDIYGNLVPESSARISAITPRPALTKTYLDFLASDNFAEWLRERNQCLTDRVLNMVAEAGNSQIVPNTLAAGDSQILADLLGEYDGEIPDRLASTLRYPG